MLLLGRQIQQSASILRPLAALAPALAVGVLACVALALVAGHGPWDLAAAIWEGAWGSADAAAATLSKVPPLLLTGLAVSLAYHAGLLNVGCEGQLTLGALASASTTIAAGSMPAWVLIPLALGTGAVTGALWALPAVWLRQRRGVHEVVTALLLNYVAAYLADYLVRGPLGDGSAIARTPLIPSKAMWLPLWHLGATGVTAAPLFAVFLTSVAAIMLHRTVWGYEVTATGSNPFAAKVSGIHVNAWQSRMFLLSGAVAGMAGAIEVAATHYRFYAAFSPGYGFDGVTVAFLVDNSPGWLWISTLLLASLRATDKWLQVALGVSPNTILVIESVLLIAVACRSGWSAMLSRIVSTPPFHRKDRGGREEDEDILDFVANKPEEP